MRITVFLVAITFLFACKKEKYSIVKHAVSDKGMVVTSHPIASDVGVEILKAGGNAADAAVAVQFTLAVVYSRAGNIGGGGFMIYRDSMGNISSLDFREIAPAAATHDMFLDSAGNVIPNISLDGMLAAGVPGSVAGMYEAHRKYGSLSWSDLLQPAIRIARKGYRLTDIEAKKINESLPLIKQHSPYPNPFTGKDHWKEGDLLRQPELAGTLELIAKEGRDGFYKGKNAILLDSLSKANKGLITKQDLENYQPLWREPLVLPWNECAIHTMPLPSSGGILVGQMLGMIKDKIVDTAGSRNIRNVHVVVEAARRSFADRAVFLGDAAFYDVPVDSMLSVDYLTQKMSDFNPDSATLSEKIITDRSHFSRDKFETTHFSIVDSDGNAAAVTTTLNDNFGNKVWVPGGGYFLNSEMDDFSSKPGAPNLFGLTGSEANAIAPGKKPLSSMTPMIIEKNNELYIVMGSRGGSTIITTLLQVFLNVEEYSMTIEDAVDLKRYHHQWLPDQITFEKGAFTKSLEDSLAAMGHKLHPIEAIGSVEAIWIDPDGRIHGAADPKLDDHAAGW